MEANHELITGVFSTQEVRKIGTGTTARKSIHKSFWFCQELQGGEDAGKIEVQPLNNNYIPSGSKRVVDKEQFLSTFSPEPEFYVSTVFPRIKEVNKTVARGERHRNNKEYYSAEMEFNKALKIDEENVRANFGLGLTYLERNESGKAEDIFSRLVKLDAAFEAEHKHLFNEFGIQLRKNKMSKEAVEYYQRALELSAGDENLHYNMARAYFERQDINKTVESLLECLKLNPTMDEGVRFLLWLLEKQLLPEELKAQVAQALKKAKEQRDGSAQADAGQTATDGAGEAAQEGGAHKAEAG